MLDKQILCNKPFAFIHLMQANNCNHFLPSFKQFSEGHYLLPAICYFIPFDQINQKRCIMFIPGLNTRTRFSLLSHLRIIDQSLSKQIVTPAILTIV